MDSIKELLLNRKSEEPEYIKMVKDYVELNYQESVKIVDRQDHLLIICLSAGLANALRFDQTQITTKCKVPKKLYFKIGSLD